MIRVYLLATIAALAITVTFTAMAQNDSPCNQGRDPEHEPRNPYAICLPEIGRMDGFLPPCHITGGSEDFGNQLAPVGDVDNSGTIDFVVGHQLCAYKALYYAEELLLYKGVVGGFPASTSGQRIGPDDTNSITKFIAAGDWDSDGNIDIAVRIQILGDTSDSNVDGYDTGQLVVFWGSALGIYTLLDTTHLSSDANMWVGINQGVGVDLDNDGIDDLLVPGGSGFSNGHLVPVAQWHLYKGHKSKRWGHGGIAYEADWRWWGGSSFTPFIVDQDGDGVKDLIWCGNDGNRSYISVLYRSSADLCPDTTAIQTAYVGKAGAAAGWSLLADVTGDGIPEILACSIVTEEIKVYVGLKGQRLLEQFGSGNDSAHPGDTQWWGRPWARIWIPYRINSQWFDDVRLFDLGDANLDGVGDIFAFSWPYVLEYNGGGKMDSLVDALIDITPGTGIVYLRRVGDIDRSGRDIIALTTGNEIRFYAPTKDISTVGVPRKLPPGTGVSTVETHPTTSGNDALTLDAIPNPSRGEIQFSWRDAGLHGVATIAIYDIAGREIKRCDTRAEGGAMRCSVHELPNGTYVAQLRVGDRTASTTIVLR